MSKKSKTLMKIDEILNTDRVFIYSEQFEEFKWNVQERCGPW